MNIVVLGAGTAGLVTALMLREKFPLYNITIVKSGDIGIVGVGEGSTEHWSEFMNFVGINLSELIRETKATVKIGILFKDWIPGKQYVHSISAAELSSLNRPEIFNQLLLNDSNVEFPLSGHFEYVFYKNSVPLFENLRPSNQYHFDTFALNGYLNKLCMQREMDIVDCEVTDAEQDVDGKITALITTTGIINGDFFVDCSGFKRVLSNKVGSKWVSKSQYLPMNHAIAFPTELDDKDDLEPYTTSTALSAGWSWKIPTQERYGNGYVFCDSYLNADQALNEININLNKNVEKAARDIKFEAGCVDKFWNKNVVCVGLSSSFAEPLEAQSIGFTIIQARLLNDCLDTWLYNPKISDVYNKKLNDSFENTISYLQLHYLTSRNDTEFWKDKPFELTDTIKDNIESFKSGIVSPVLFDDNSFMFGVFNWYQVLAGLDIIDKNKLSLHLQNNRSVYNNIFYNKAINIRNNQAKTTKITHRQYLDIVMNNTI
jgi:flavin-dependent dehydrogenase